MTTDYAAEAAKLRAMSRQQYRQARRDAEDAARQYAAAKIMRTLAAAGGTLGDGAEYDQTARIMLSYADTLLDISFNCTDRGRFYGRLARRYRRWADEQAARVPHSAVLA